MSRVKTGYVTHRRHKKVLKLASGYFGAKHLLYRTAHEQVMHSLKYAYRDRKNLKREMRKLWIARINAAAHMNDINYSNLMHGLKLANIDINRKMLSEIAIHDPKGFSDLVKKAKDALNGKPVKEEVAEEKPVVAQEKAEKPAAKKTTKKATEEKAEKPAAKKTTKKVAADGEKKPAAKKITKKDAE